MQGIGLVSLLLYVTVSMRAISPMSPRNRSRVAGRKAEKDEDRADNTVQ